MPPQNRILLISSEFAPAPGGIGNHAYSLAKALQGEGYDITVLAETLLDAVTIAQLENFDAGEKFTTHRILRQINDNILLAILKRFRKAFQLLKKGSYDVCICSGKFPLWIGKVMKAFFPKTKFIAIAHGTEINYSNKILRSVTDASLASFDAIISVSHYTQGLLPSEAAGLRVVIPNGVYTDLPANLQRRNIRGKPSLLTVGTMSPRKGQHNVIEALPQIMKDFPQVHYHIVGMPTFMERLTSMAAKLNLQEQVTFHKFLSRSEVDTLYASADIFIMLSERQEDGDVEGFGIAILEANLYGKPAIGAKGCGIEDAISHGRTGMLVDPKNAQDITMAIREILSNYEYYSENARQWAISHDWVQIAKQYRRTIDGLISK